MNITNPRAILNEIREAFDLMMEDGETHRIAQTGVRLNLRGFLGKCDGLFPFVHPQCCPTEFDWNELKALRMEVAEQRRVIKDLTITLDQSKEMDEQISKLESEVQEQRRTSEAEIARCFGQDKVVLAREAFNKGYDAGQQASQQEIDELKARLRRWEEPWDSERQDSP